MKKFVFIFAFILAFVCLSCGSDNGYNQKEADELIAKIKDGSEFSQDDYAKAIKLMRAATDVAFEKLDNMKGLSLEEMQKKTSEIEEDPELKKMGEATDQLSSYLLSHSSDLDDKNSEALKALQDDILKKTMEFQQSFSL